MSKLRHRGAWATFSEEDSKKIRRVGTILQKIVFETAANNRDTQMIEEAVEILRKVYEWQYEEIYPHHLSQPIRKVRNI